MKSILALTVVSLAFNAPAFAQTSIGGRYSVEGTNLNGSTYRGEAEINLTSDTTCEISWVTGSTTSVGICMRSDEVFSAAYRMGNVIGLVIYKVSPDGSMNGTWTIAGNGGAGTEVLSPLK